VTNDGSFVVNLVCAGATNSITGWFVNATTNIVVVLPTLRAW